MERTPKLTDLQLILLTTAAQRPDGSLLPPPDRAAEQLDRIVKAVASLIKRGFATEIDVGEQSRSWRSDADRLIGVVISDDGRLAIGVELPTEPSSDGSGANDQPASPRSAEPGPKQPSDLPGEQVGQPAPTPSAPREGSKQALVVGLMSRAQGATLAELVEATGWLPHTTRAALTGLRKKGHALVKAQRGGATCYRIGAAA